MTAATETTTTQGTEQAAAPKAPKVNSTAQRLVNTRYASFIGPRGSFQPGHDAKAKSQMIRDAIQTEDPQLAADAEAALEVMSWGHFLTAKRDMIAKGGSAESKPRTSRAKAEKAEGGANGGGSAPAATKSKSADETAAGFHVRRGKSGYFVMNGPDAGVVKYNTAEEANEVVGFLERGAVTVDQVKSAENLDAIRSLAANAAEGQSEATGEADPGETATDAE